MQGDIEPFVSPIDKTVIKSRSHLRDHNRKHGVTDYRDYGESWFKRKAKERKAALTASSDRNRRERLNDIHKAIQRYS